MTKSDAIFYRLAMPCPFAKEGTITPIGNSSSENSVNFRDGFPSVYSAAGGKYITRGEMNAIGNLASQNQFFFLAGGINTFDATFAQTIQGYPEGAVLKYLNNGYLYDVVSLVDNNMIDFTDVGVDGINWKYLSVAEKLVFDDVFFEGGTGVSVGSALLGVVKAKKTSGIVLNASLSPTTGENIYEASYAGDEFLKLSFGCGIMINDFGSSYPNTINMPYNAESGYGVVTPNWYGWKSLSGNFTFAAGTNSVIVHKNQDDAGVLGVVNKDNYYGIALMCGIGELVNDTTNYRVNSPQYESIIGTLKIVYSQ